MPQKSAGTCNHARLKGGQTEKNQIEKSGKKTPSKLHFLSPPRGTKNSKVARGLSRKEEILIG